MQLAHGTDRSGQIRIVQDRSGLFWTDQDCSGQIRTVLDRSGLFRTDQDRSGLFWTDQDCSGLIRTVLDRSGLIRTVQDRSGLFRTDQDCSGSFCVVSAFQELTFMYGFAGFHNDLVWNNMTLAVCVTLVIPSIQDCSRYAVI